MRGSDRLAQRPIWMLLVALTALLSSGCVSRIHSLYLGLPDDRIGGVRLASFEPSVGEPFTLRLEDRLRLEDAGREGRHRLTTIVTPSVGANGQDDDLVTATLYQSTVPGRKRLVVVLPIWGSSEYPPRQIVKRLIHRGGAERTHVLEIHGRSTLFDWQAIGAAGSEAELLAALAESGQRLVDTAVDVRRLIDWAERRGDVDPARIGIVGFSIGAFAATLVMGQDERLSAGVLVMGGAHLHQTLGSCRGRSGEVRRQVRERFGWDDATYSRKIESTMAPYSPARFAPDVHPSRVLLIDAALDHCMPETSRDHLWEALGRPERISLDYGHHVAFFSMSPLGFHYTTRRIIDFLDRRLPASELPSTSPSGAESLAAR